MRFLVAGGAAELPGLRCGRLTQHVAAIRAAEVGNERGSSRWPDLRISAKSVQRRREGRGIGVFEVGQYAKTFLHIGNRTGQLRTPVDQMVDQHNPIIPAPAPAVEGVRAERDD